MRFGCINICTTLEQPTPPQGKAKHLSWCHCAIRMIVKLIRLCLFFLLQAATSLLAFSSVKTTYSVYLNLLLIIVCANAWGACVQESQRGVLVTHVAVTSCSEGVLQAMDVLMKFDGSQVWCCCLVCGVVVFSLSQLGVRVVWHASGARYRCLHAAM